MKRLITLLAAIMLLAFVVAGCGDDDAGSGSNGGDTAAETETDATIESGDTSAPANLDEAVDRCKESINDSPQISDDAKSKLEGICEKAGSGDEQQVEEAAREVCETIVDESIPEGSPGREAALSACDAGK